MDLGPLTNSLESNHLVPSISDSLLVQSSNLISGWFPFKLLDLCTCTLTSMEGEDNLGTRNPEVLSEADNWLGGLSSSIVSFF